MGSDKRHLPVRLATLLCAGVAAAGCTQSPSGGSAAGALPSAADVSSAAGTPSGAVGAGVATAPAAPASSAPASAAAPSSAAPSPASPAGSVDPAERLRALARAAAGRSWSAHYRLVENGQAAVAVTVASTPAAYRIDIAGAGSTSVFVADRHGDWTCEVTHATRCFLAAAPGHPLPAALDPGLEKVFRDYLRELAAHPQAYTLGSDGSCFTVRRRGPATARTVGKGTYCWNGDGVLTKYVAPSGTLTLTSVGPAPGPAAVATPQSS